MEEETHSLVSLIQDLVTKYYVKELPNLSGGGASSPIDRIIGLLQKQTSKIDVEVSIQIFLDTHTLWQLAVAKRIAREGSDPQHG